MYDGPFSLGYSEALHFAAQEMGSTCLIQPILRSSYRQFGISTLDSDAEDLYQLVSKLSSKRVILIGHSSGCNGILHFVHRFLPTLCSEEADMIRGKICGIVLQGAVSDRQYIVSVLGETKATQFLETSKALISSGQAHSIMPAEAVPMEPIVPITAKRFYSLLQGDDEMFSTDKNESIMFSVSETLPILVFISDKDEYVPHNQVNQSSVVSFFSKILPHHASNKIVVLRNANHGLSTLTKEQVVEHFINPIVQWIGTL